MILEKGDFNFARKLNELNIMALRSLYKWVFRGSSSCGLIYSSSFVQISFLCNLLNKCFPNKMSWKQELASTSRDGFVLMKFRVFDGFIFMLLIINQEKKIKSEL